jgi:hypothetical protein
MTTYLEQAVTRICAMCEACIANTHAFPQPFAWSETTPYWTLDLSDFEPGEFYGTENSQRIYIAEIRYIIGHITEGYEGQPVERIYADRPGIETFFEERRGLETDTDTDPLTELDPLETELLPSPVTQIFTNGGLGIPQVGTTIRLKLTFNIGINPE